jgi:hypothetical protein
MTQVELWGKCINKKHLKSQERKNNGCHNERILVSLLYFSLFKSVSCYGSGEFTKAISLLQDSPLL